jgi:hypothetical protein
VQGLHLVFARIQNFEPLLWKMQVASRYFLADIREFGLTWDDCYDYLHKLGYDVKVELLEVK